MGQRKVSETAELSATEASLRLLPLLKEYVDKLAALSERAATVLQLFGSVSAPYVAPVALEAGRLICLRDTLEKPMIELAREASGLVEHAELEHYLYSELKLRLDELEEHIRFSAVMVGDLVVYLTNRKDQAERVRKLVEKSGRYKAPF
jgi:hypothetical protein